MKRILNAVIAALMLILLASCTGKTNTVVVPAIQFAAPGAEEIAPPEMASSIKLDSTTMQVYYIDIPDGETMFKEFNSVSEIASDNVELVRKTDDGYWMYKAGEGTLLIDTSAGSWTYSTPLPSAAPDNMPTDAQAQQIAAKEIADSGLKIGSTSDSGVLSYTTDGDEKILQKDVIFYPTVDGKNVYGIFRTTVGIGEGGKTVYFSKQSFEPKAGGEVKLKSIDEVKQSISKGKFISNAAGASGTATITDYELCYYCDGVAKDGKLYVQPVYVFSAEIDNDTGEAEHFKVFVDAASQG
jgi:hypothetical protein